MSKRVFIVAMALTASLFAVCSTAGEVGDIEFKRATKEVGDYPPATYPHWVHRMQYRCYVCHEEIFKMKAGADVITMPEIEDGKFCGKCHNGKIAFGVVFEACPRCHRP